MKESSDGETLIAVGIWFQICITTTITISVVLTGAQSGS